jgi:DnaJ-class molecular chaperone
MASVDYYKILGLERNASQDEILKAYRILALKYHPDRNPDEEAKIMFQQITEAKDILTDPERKMFYDRFGHINGMAKQQVPPKQTVRMSMPLVVSLVDALNPRITEMKYEIRKNVPCESCKNAPYSTIVCTTCSGIKYIVQTETLNVNIPQHYLRKPFSVVVDAGPNINGYPTDLAINFKLDLPKDYHITTDLKLMHTIRISFTESICGFSAKYVHPGGNIYILFAKRGLIINPNAIYILENLGLHGEELYVNFVITYPEQITLPQNVALSFNNLEHALGPRTIPNEILNDYAREQILYLDQLKKVIKMDEADEADQDYQGEPQFQQFQQGASNIQCAQQ